ncbi:MAG: hypothetical protein SGJ24_09365 [Chloroflexota bacterium]|nr:hypothetical protein [Chloroflexota bacterium]
MRQLDKACCLKRLNQRIQLSQKERLNSIAPPRSQSPCQTARKLRID